jgi:hypothetical protein
VFVYTAVKRYDAPVAFPSQQATGQGLPLAEMQLLNLLLQSWETRHALGSALLGSQLA